MIYLRYTYSKVTRLMIFGKELNNKKNLMKPYEEIRTQNHLHLLLTKNELSCNIKEIGSF